MLPLPVAEDSEGGEDSSHHSIDSNSTSTYSNTTNITLTSNSSIDSNSTGGEVEGDEIQDGDKGGPDGYVFSPDGVRTQTPTVAPTRSPTTRPTMPTPAPTRLQDLPEYCETLPSGEHTIACVDRYTHTPYIQTYKHHT
jgi:hypothetical protein